MDHRRIGHLLGVGWLRQENPKPHKSQIPKPKRLMTRPRAVRRSSCRTSHPHRWRQRIQAHSDCAIVRRTLRGSPGAPDPGVPTAPAPWVWRAPRSFPTAWRPLSRFPPDTTSPRRAAASASRRARARRADISAKSFSDTFPIPRSNSSSLIDRSTSVFSRSSAARVRSPIASPASSRSVPASGRTVRRRGGADGRGGKDGAAQKNDRGRCLTAREEDDGRADQPRQRKQLPGLQRLRLSLSRGLGAHRPGARPVQIRCGAGRRRDGALGLQRDQRRAR